VTQKNQTPNEGIDWCEQLEVEGPRLASALPRRHDMAAYGVVRGQTSAYEKTADHCRSMLGPKTPVRLIDMNAKGTKPSNRLIKDFPEAVCNKKDTK
jgi:hypothetical protein